MQHIKDLDDFLKDIKKNIVEGKSLSEEQSRTYKKLQREIDSHTPKRLNEDYCNKDQQILVDREFQYIKSISTDIYTKVDLICTSHPTLSVLTAQRSLIGKRYYILLNDYQSIIPENRIASQGYKHELSCIVYLIQEYKIMEKNFHKDNKEKDLKPYEKTLLRLHREMLQKYEETLRPFLKYCMPWAREREASEEKDTIPFLAPQKDSG